DFGEIGVRKGRQERAALIEETHASVSAARRKDVRHAEITLAIDRDTGGKLSRIVNGRRRTLEARGVHLNAAIVRIGDVKVPCCIERETLWLREASQLRRLHALGVENIDHVVRRIGNNDRRAALSIDFIADESSSRKVGV